MCPHTTICVLILLKCPHTCLVLQTGMPTHYVSSYYFYMSPHTTPIYVLILLLYMSSYYYYICPHTTNIYVLILLLYVSSYYFYICPHTTTIYVLLYMFLILLLCVLILLKKKATSALMDLPQQSAEYIYLCPVVKKKNISADGSPAAVSGIHIYVYIYIYMSSYCSKKAKKTSALMDLPQQSAEYIYIYIYMSSYCSTKTKKQQHQR
jgi:hypothetical protein